MDNPRYFSLGWLAGGEVGVLHSLPSQDILIQDSEVARRLANLLDPGAATTIQRGQTSFLKVPHSRDVDALLFELVDLFIAIRYAHPALVQLELAPSDTGWMSIKPSEP